MPSACRPSRGSALRPSPFPFPLWVAKGRPARKEEHCPSPPAPAILRIRRATTGHAGCHSCSACTREDVSLIAWVGF
eukprot:4298369-Prymnesium_polylepis.1